MIELSNVSKCYGDKGLVQAIRNLNLRVVRGERVAVMGPSGSGKSSLLNLICGLDDPTSGIWGMRHVEMRSVDENTRTVLTVNKRGF